ncbi:hypothetical protein HPB52_013345 [Rhipicephalus sanguineus]|uniref:Uncharacterized protein n=1 Tax=Rhipicephalus sanguineus TaxID=34632 RepID=A0A9D4SQF2_RHISA|nr:hypothetical protein HPB52_013345 [Rhipicephalus sanguineus]
MSSADIEKLCCSFYVLSHEELHSLDHLNLPWLGPVRGLTLLPAVDRIRSSLRSTQGLPECLHYMAILYSWLITRGIYNQWYLYRLDPTSLHHDPSAIGQMLVHALQKSSNTVTGDGVVDMGSTLCLTVLTPDEARPTPEYRPVRFCMWRGLPFVAVHVPGMNVPEATHWPALASVLGDLDRCLQGAYQDLKSAHSAAENFR